MIYVPDLRTNRLVVAMREISMVDAIAVAQIHPDFHEQSTTAFLRSVCHSIQSAHESLQDPQHWTVQERMFAVSNYLAAVEVASDNDPDFPLGTTGRYSDYLIGGTDVKAVPEGIPVGTVGGDEWRAGYLTGAQAEAIERLQDEFSAELPEYLAWLYWDIGLIAVQLHRQGEVRPDPATDFGAYDEWLSGRMRTFFNYAESDFEAMLPLLANAERLTRHFFKIGAGKRGIVALPQEGRAELPPVRFRPDDGLSEWTKTICRGNAEAGG